METSAVYCPRCKSARVFHVSEWKAESLDDVGNECELDEWQCEDCEGRSFWL